MILMEGLMSVPPERGTFIGRALWKPRYVVLGTGAHLKTQTDILSESTGKSSSRKGLKSTPSKPNLAETLPPQEDSQNPRLYVSIYKAKGDWEFVSQHPVSAFTTCEIRTLQHRKQGTSLPTLMLELKPDSMSEKQRKRRSSRTAGLTSKDPWANVLLFRTVADERHTIYDWQAAIRSKLTIDTPEDSPLTPMSPSFNAFSNPFAPRESKGSPRPDLSQRSSSHTINTYPHAPRDRPSNIISPSPSLRSRRSDLSSQSSSLHPPIGFTSHLNNYPNTLPSDLPSPASTYETQFIEGWTSAQGRSSALSSHTRGSNSIASAVNPSSPMASTPPGPRETILDRAFQLRYIPGSGRVGDIDEEKISSIARFEALMKEVDEKKKQKGLVSQNRNKEEWGLDEESEDSDDVESGDEGEEKLEMPTPAQRALDFISGRRVPPPPSARPLSPPPRSPPIPFLNSQAMSAFHGGPSASNNIRPRAGTTSSRNKTSRPSSMALPSRSMSTATIPTLKENMSGNGNLKADDRGKEKRRSSTSVKRLSFQEFTKRLSSTSSLLLVQTNASSSSGKDGSRRTSSEYGFEGLEGGLRSPGLSGDNRDKRCGWRGSVGVFGGEGGFL
ncbi:hypothetical protein GLAREA_10325 [Glarea lozoyensis ATCC 20868]|uniref:Uncharacterized protein n=1 Tax=Glarea lozoyensis (strain ATCC 20868 / MF5171) TaxID=1116229 RepID=S3DRK5_GLAL2|nr:uncharacterized protein GLAREA_10325 [Glarea lozoyensis ATCC 20868]EPE34631.1 hypothetical protein GLAREA_10325 [Glarea lozoyensis ATCC 20868]